MSKSHKIVILGDICPTVDYGWLFQKPAESLFHGILPMIQSADLAVCNLECPITCSSKKIDKTGPHLRALPEQMRILQEAGIRVFSLANNHILDYGQPGFADTISYLKKNRLDYFGGGENGESASKAFFYDLGDAKIGFLAFAEHEFNIATKSSAGANLFDPYSSLPQIKNAKQQCDWLVVLYHGGIEYYRYPSPLLQRKCRAMVDAGANLVLCQHSHCIGTREKYNNSEILYGQGNSVFGYKPGCPMWNKGLVVELDIRDRNLSSCYRLIKASSDGIDLIDHDSDVEFMNNFYQESYRINDQDFIAEQWEEYCEQLSAWYLPMLTGKNRIINKLNRISNGVLMKLLVRKKARKCIINLLRCDAHREVLETFLSKQLSKF